MVYIIRKRSIDTLLYTLAGELFLDAGRFADEVSDTLRTLFPMKELFLAYVDPFKNQFSFHHGPEVTEDTIQFYRDYPIEVLPDDYMARGAFTHPVGTVIIDRESFDDSNAADIEVQRRALEETSNGTMALALLTAPSQFSRSTRAHNPFLRYGVISLTVYGDRYDDSYGPNEKKLLYRYLRALRMGILNSPSVSRGQVDTPCIGGRPIFTFSSKMEH